MFIDTHAHLYSPEFDSDREIMIQRALDAGVGRIYLPNVEAGTIKPLLTLRDYLPDVLYPLMGLHPCSVKSDFADQLQIMKAALKADTYYGIGEIGLDLHWDPSTLPWQVDAFKIQCQWACELNLPIIIHSREAVEQVIEILQDMHPRPSRGVFHCFSGNQDQAHKISELGEYYFGLGGVITFKNSGMKEVVLNLPLDKIVLETDAPYLAPVPYRGKRNESSYLTLVAEKLAEMRGLTLEVIEQQTTENALNLYRLS